MFFCNILKYKTQIQYKSKSKTYGGFFSKTIKSIENILHNEKPNYLIVQATQILLLQDV